MKAVTLYSKLQLQLLKLRYTVYSFTTLNHYFACARSQPIRYSCIVDTPPIILHTQWGYCGVTKGVPSEETIQNNCWSVLRIIVRIVPYPGKLNVWSTRKKYLGFLAQRYATIRISKFYILSFARLSCLMILSAKLSSLNPIVLSLHCIYTLFLCGKRSVDAKKMFEIFVRAPNNFTPLVRYQVDPFYCLTLGSAV